MNTQLFTKKCLKLEGNPLLYFNEKVECALKNFKLSMFNLDSGEGNLPEQW